MKFSTENHVFSSPAVSDLQPISFQFLSIDLAFCCFSFDFSCGLQDFKFWYVNRKAFGASFLHWVDFTNCYLMHVFTHFCVVGIISPWRYETRILVIKLIWATNYAYGRIGGTYHVKALLFWSHLLETTLVYHNRVKVILKSHLKLSQNTFQNLFSNDY